MHMAARQTLKVNASLRRRSGCLSLDSPWVRCRRNSDDEEERPSDYGGTTALEETLDTSHDRSLHMSRMMLKRINSGCLSLLCTVPARGNFI
jgi:hypothetical protein